MRTSPEKFTVAPSLTYSSPSLPSWPTRIVLSTWNVPGPETVSLEVVPSSPMIRNSFSCSYFAAPVNVIALSAVFVVLPPNLNVPVPESVSGSFSRPVS